MKSIKLIVPVALTRMCLCVLLFASISVQANEFSNNEEPDLSELGSAGLFLKTSSGIKDAPVLNSGVSVSITGMVAKVELTQTFINDSNDWIEGIYAFPLPDQAAVNSLLVTIGERKLIGKIREKRQAEKQYEQAKKAGHAVSLVKQHRPNLFSSRFANVPPGETLSIALTYVQTVRYESDRYSLRIPLTLTPRYVNNLVTDIDAITPPQQHLADYLQSGQSGHLVTIDTILHGVYDAYQVSSPSHTLQTTSNDNTTSVSLAKPAHLDRDFILEWHEKDTATPAVKVWREQVNNEEYLLATVMPPRNDADIPYQPRELILVIDTSGSMAGDAMTAAIATLVDAIAGLRPEDSFNIIEFNSDYTSFFDSPQPATPDNRKAAQLRARRLYADGGTEMLAPLREALGYSDTNLLRQVVFITDGSVGYEETVIESIKNTLGNARLFTVGIGTAPNHWFMRKVAAAGRGTFHNISSVSEVSGEMSKLLRKLESPALTDLQVSVEGGTAEIMPDPIPDLYANEPVVVAAKLDSGVHSLNVSGRWGDQNWHESISIDNAPRSGAGLSSVWAKQKMESLLDKQRAHSDPEFYRSLITSIALDHQLVSPYTSFIAIEPKPIKPASEQVVAKKVLNLMPAGSEMQAIPFPQGAAGIDTLLWMSLLSAMVALLLTYWRLFFAEDQHQ